MIVHKIDKTFQTRSDKPNSNWLNDNNYIVIPDNSPLANKIMQYFPRFDFVLDENDNLIDVVEIPKTEEELKQERIEEILSELKVLDDVIKRETEQLYSDVGITPSYQPMADTIVKKKELRAELEELKEELAN